MKYEYHVIPEYAIVSLGAEVNTIYVSIQSMADGGWRLAHVIEKGSHKMFIYERPVKKSFWKRVFGK